MPALALAVGLAAIVAHGVWVQRAIIDTARAQTAQLSSEQGQPTLAQDVAPVSYYLDFDGYYFVSYAQEIARGGGPRIRSTRLDATPDGRPVYWSSAFPWWLVALGQVHGWLSGEPADRAIASAAYYANPILLGLAALLAGWGVWRAVGAIPAAAVVLTIATHPRMLEDFGYAKPDHHGLHLLFALGLILCAVVGSGANRESARRWMIASGILGGLGLWAGATQTSVVVAAVGLGGALSIAVGRGSEASFQPELWRSWARAGAATSLFAYGIEYLPGAPEMRLEVNHPLYALAWFGGGEVLFGIGRLRENARNAWRPVALGLLCALALPGAVALGPVDWFLPKDATMLNLHQRIEEFAPFFAAQRSGLATVWALGVPTFGAIAASLWFAVGRPLPRDRSVGWIALAPCWVLAPWFIAQGRWFGWFSVAGICALVWLWNASSQHRSVRVGVLAAVGLGVLANLMAIGDRVSQPVVEDAPSALSLDLFMRDFAANLCAPDPRRGPVRVMTGPAEAARVHFFGRCRGVGTPFWENRDGVRDTAGFFTAVDDADGRRILERHQIDYVLVANNVAFIEYMDVTRYGSLDPERARQTLGYRLISGAAPPWLSPIGLRGWPAARHWRIYSVAD